MLMVNNRTVGRLVELTGNRVRMDGLKYSVDCPEIGTGHKCTIFFGYHEPDERALVKRYLPVDLPVVEFGGGIGVVACLANRKLSSPHRHIVVEANPSIAALLERNRDLNHCEFQVITAGLAYGSATTSIGVSSEFVGSRIDGDFDAKISAASITLGQIVEDAGFDRLSLICDVEGAEADLMRHESDLIAERVGFAMIEIHPNILGQDGEDQVVSGFLSAGFRVVDRIGWNWVFAKP